MSKHWTVPVLVTIRADSAKQATEIALVEMEYLSDISPLVDKAFIGNEEEVRQGTLDDLLKEEHTK